MSDDQQLTNSIETHSEPSTSANDLQVKISKNTRLFTSNAKKLKKHQPAILRSDVNSKIKAKSKSKASTSTESVPANTVGSATATAATAALATSNQERNAGSVVITIRLLKMESTRGFEVNSVGNELAQIDNYSNNNITNSNSSGGSNKNNNTNNNSKSNNNNNNQTTQAYSANTPENSAQRQNCNFNMDDHSSSVKQIEAGALTANGICDNGNREQSSVKQSHVNVCDNVPFNCTSQMEQQSTVLKNCLAQTFNEIRLSEPITVRSSAPASPTMEATATAAAPITDPKSTKSVKHAFIPSNLIGTVSPYPHHIPIANIIRSDCFNGIVDERKCFCNNFLLSSCKHNARKCASNYLSNCLSIYQ